MKIALDGVVWIANIHLPNPKKILVFLKKIVVIMSVLAVLLDEYFQNMS